MTTSRRVTVIAHELLGFTPAGGMGTATSLLALGLTRMGHNVELLLGLNDPANMKREWREMYVTAGIAIRAMPTSDEDVEPWYFSQLRAVELGLRADPPDVVVAHDFGAPAYSALRLREAGLGFEDTLFVVFCHGTRRYVLDLLRAPAVPDLPHVLAIGLLEQRAIELADAVVSPSRFLIDWMRGQDWKLPENVRVVPYFTRSLVTGQTIRVANDRGGERLERLAFFGRVDERKGLKLFADALSSLEPHLLEGLEVEFIGKTTATWPPARAASLLSSEAKQALTNVSFRGELAQDEALERLQQPGTVAVMPSLQENSPNAIYECLERRIPFVATRVGGVPELIAEEDRGRVLCAPTTEALGSMLRNLLVDRVVPAAPRAGFDPSEPFDGWHAVLQSRPRSQPPLESGDVGETGSGRFVLLADDEYTFEDELAPTLFRAQRASGADVVTCGVRIDKDGETTIRFFSGEPGGLGVLANDYGEAALVRRTLLERVPTPQMTRGDMWALLAGLAAAGAQIVSVPAPLVRRSARQTPSDDDPAAALAVATELERAVPRSARSAARLAAGLAADSCVESATARRHTFALAVALLTLLAAAIRFTTLGRQSYWYDELVTVSLLHRSFAGMLHGVARTEATPYLYYVLSWPWTRVFGLAEAGLRSFSALAGALTIPATYAAGSKLVGRRVGLLAAALVAVNPFLVWYSQEARAYALFAFFGATTLYFLAGAMRNEQRAFVGWSITAALAVATHYFAVFLIAAEALLLLARAPRRTLLAVALPMVVAVAEIPLLVKQHSNGGNLSASPLSHRVAGIPKELVVGYSFPAELAGTVFALLLVAVGIALVFVGPSANRRRASITGAIAVFVVAIPVVLALAGADYVLARNVIAATVPAAIFIATGYASRSFGLAAALVLCALSLAIVGSVAADTRYGRTDWRGAAHAVGPAMGARAIVVTPTIDSSLWARYISGLSEPPVPSLRIREIDVLGLATQGRFSLTAVHPPNVPPRPAPAGFRLVATWRTPTYELVRYRSGELHRVATPTLAGLRLAAGPGPVFLQGAGRPRR